MKKAFILIVLSIALLGCIQTPEPVESTAGFKDCGNSEECIKAEMENCGKAFATKTEGDEDIRLTAKLTVYGPEAEGKCRIEMKIEKLEPVSEEAKAGLGIIGTMIQHGRILLRHTAGHDERNTVTGKKRLTSPLFHPLTQAPLSGQWLLLQQPR